MAELTQEQQRVRTILIEIARKGQPKSYTDLVRMANLDLDMTNPYHRNLLGQILGGISVYEHANGRPCCHRLLSRKALVCQVMASINLLMNLVMGTGVS